VYSVLVCVSPVESHVAPLLEVAKAFLDLGWHVRVLTGDRFADRVAAVGAHPIALPPEADVIDPSAPGGRSRGVRAINLGLEKAFIEPAPAQYLAIRSALGAQDADAVVGDVTVLGMNLLNSAPTRPVLAVCGIVPLTASSVDTAPFGLGMRPWPGRAGRVRNRLLSWASRSIVFARVQRRADELYRSAGMPGLGRRFFFDYIFSDGMIDIFGQFTVSGFEYPRTDLPPAVQFFGPLRSSSPSNFRPPAWWSDLDGSRPVVLVSQGTVANDDFAELVGPALEALADEPVLIVVTTGAAGGPAGRALPPIPANARVAEFLPYAELMPKVSVFVTNGGYCGLHEAMTHGVPIVVAGDTEDKVETSARVVWSGVGISLTTGHPTAAAIRTAVRAVLANPRYRAASGRIGEQISAAPGAAGFAKAVERLVRERAERST